MSDSLPAFPPCASNHHDRNENEVRFKQTRLNGRARSSNLKLQQSLFEKILISRCIRSPQVQMPIQHPNSQRSPHPELAQASSDRAESARYQSMYGRTSNCMMCAESSSMWFGKRDRAVISGVLALSTARLGH
jgi:hypothetical protein